jgi:hypothetical protein
MYIDIAHVYFYSQTDYIRQTDIKLTSSNGNKSQKFVSLIDAPYFKNVFAPRASIRRNTVDEKNHSINIWQLADDTTLFMSSKEEITSALNEMEIFGSLSGLMLNRNKIQGMWVGK